MLHSTVRMMAAVAAVLVMQSAHSYSPCTVTAESPEGSCWLETFDGVYDADLTAAGWVLGEGVTGADYSYQPFGWEGGSYTELYPTVGDSVLELYPSYPTPTSISKSFDLWSEGWLVFLWSVGNTADPRSAIVFETGGYEAELGMNYWEPIGDWWKYWAYTPGGEDFHVGFSVHGRTVASTAPILILDSIMYIPDSGLIDPGAPVPLPPALLLLGSALAGLGFMRRRVH